MTFRDVECQDWQIDNTDFKFRISQINLNVSKLFMSKLHWSYNTFGHIFFNSHTTSIENVEPRQFPAISAIPYSPAILDIARLNNTENSVLYNKPVHNYNQNVNEQSKMEMSHFQQYPHISHAAVNEKR